MEVEYVRITEEAGSQIHDHPEILSEDFLVSLVLSVPKTKRDYYESNRFALRTRRKDRNGNWKSVLVRVAENRTVYQIGESKIMNIEYVILLGHVESLSR